MKNLPLSDSILATLAYCDIFQYPLTELELEHRLIGTAQVSNQQISQALKKLALVKKTEEYLVLQGSEPNVAVRNKRAYFSKLKRVELQTLTARLAKIPFISSVYVTGSLAMNNVSSVADDIDLLIVTKPGTMWLTRLIVVLWTSLIGKYRLHGTNGEWGWCFNLWLDQNHLEIPKQDRSIYTAYEVIQAQLLLGTENQLRRANRWVSEYINYPSEQENAEDYKIRRNSESFFQKFVTILLQPIDWVCYVLQVAYMQPKRTRERIGRGFAFFHPRDTKHLILKKWMVRLEKLGISNQSRAALHNVFEKGLTI